MEWPLLEGVPAEDVRQVLAIARRHRFSKGEVVFHQDDPADSLHLISKGRFAVRVTTPDGDVATLITLTQEAVAELAGASRATVNQALREEERRGTFELQHGKTRVLDLGELQRGSR